MAAHSFSPLLMTGPPPAELSSNPELYLKVVTEPAHTTLLTTELAVLLNYHHPSLIEAKEIYLELLLESRQIRATLALERGQPLLEWLAQQRPDAQCRRRLMWELLDGLAFLEDHGLIHGDIKPDNLVIISSHLKIIDFNLMHFEWWSRVPSMQTYADQAAQQYQVGSLSRYDYRRSALFALTLTLCFVAGLETSAPLSYLDLQQAQQSPLGWLQRQAGLEPSMKALLGNIFHSSPEPGLFGRLRTMLDSERPPAHGRHFESPMPVLTGWAGDPRSLEIQLQTFYRRAAQIGCDLQTTEKIFELILPRLGWNQASPELFHAASLLAAGLCNAELSFVRPSKKVLRLYLRLLVDCRCQVRPAADWGSHQACELLWRVLHPHQWNSPAVQPWPGQIIESMAMLADYKFTEVITAEGTVDLLLLKDLDEIWQEADLLEEAPCPDIKPNP